MRELSPDVRIFLFAVLSTIKPGAEISRGAEGKSQERKENI